MDDWLNRLLEEYSDLDKRANKLRAFLDSRGMASLNPEAQQLLRLQMKQMNDLLSTMLKRVRLGLLGTTQ